MQPETRNQRAIKNRKNHTAVIMTMIITAYKTDWVGMNNRAPYIIDGQGKDKEITRQLSLGRFPAFTSTETDTRPEHCN